MAFLLVAMAGLGIVGWQRFDSSASFLPFLLTLAGAFGGRSATSATGRRIRSNR